MLLVYFLININIGECEFLDFFYFLVKPELYLN